MAVVLLLLILLQLTHSNLLGSGAAAAEGTSRDSSVFVKVAHHRSQIRRSFTFPPHAFGRRTEDIRLVGNAAVMGDGSVKIPAIDRPTNQAGRALFASPVRMWDPNTSLAASFETSFSFVIHQESSSTSSSGWNVSSRRSGGGLAFIIAPDEMTVGREGGYLGMLSDACVHRRREEVSVQQRQQHHPVIAVEFDTFRDVEFGDPNDNHVGVNLGSVVSAETADLSTAGVYLRDGSLVTARISYDSSSQLLQVRVANSSSSQGGASTDFDLLYDDHLPLISSPVDLSSFLKEYMFVGFSASTGAEALTHTVLTWNFSCSSHAVQKFPTVFANREEVSRAEECQDDIVEDKFDHESSSKRTHPPPAFFVFISVGATFLFILFNLLVFCRRSRSQPQVISSSSERWALPVAILPRPRPVHKPREFDLQELMVATGDFAEKQRLGEGPQGGVYRGSLQDGSLVAIKRFTPSPPWFSTSYDVRDYLFCVPVLSKSRKQRQRLVTEFLPALSRLKHPHLVSVRGWCCGSQEVLVVYDYMPNASLDKWLHPAEALLTLPWIHRWKLAGDVASALHYLHSSSFLHTRLKSSNVLLDITFQARVGDFGLLPPRPAKAWEYHHPPEVSATSGWTQKMDVYGFGIICLELVTGGPPDVELVDRAWLLHEDSKSLIELLDSRLEKSFDLEQAMVLCGLGLLCTHPDPNSRPTMELVLSSLEGRTEIPPIPARISVDS